MNEPPLIDSHAHVWTRDMPFIDNPRHTPNYDFTAEDYLAQLNAHGVQMAVLSGASLFGDYNDYMIECLRKYKRLRGTIIPEPNMERVVLEDMKKDGVVGLRLMFRAVETPPDITTYEWRKLFRRARDLGWHVHLHTEGPRLAAYLEFLETTGVKLVIDHFGTPSAEKGIECDGFQRLIKSIEKGNTWVKISAGYRLEPGAAKIYTHELLRRVGPDRLLWASDSPFASCESRVTYQSVLEEFYDWIPDSLTRRKVSADNPIELFFSS